LQCSKGYGRIGFFKVALTSMKSGLPATGTEQLLGMLSPFVPDQYLQEHWPAGRTGGRRGAFSAAQLWRVHLLALLTPAHSLNLLVRLLSEQRGWRQFAHLSHRQRVPDVRMLHEFRERLGVSGARQINEQLLEALLESVDLAAPSVGLMDATDLEASCRGFKKKGWKLTQRAARPKASGALKSDRASGLWGTKSTACDCGFRAINVVCFWCPW
jgi:hypothetical protein